jgi:hypothetical protein
MGVRLRGRALLARAEHHLGGPVDEMGGVRLLPGFFGERVIGSLDHGWRVKARATRRPATGRVRSVAEKSRLLLSSMQDPDPEWPDTAAELEDGALCHT